MKKKQKNKKNLYNRAGAAFGEGVIEEVVDGGVHGHVLVAFAQNAVHLVRLN